MKKFTQSIVLASPLIAPLVTFAAGSTLMTVIERVISYLNVILALLMGVAVVAFVYNVVRYFIIKPDEERKEANMYIMWSLIGFFIILSFWGLVNILMATFDFGDNTPGSWDNFMDIFPR